MENLVDEKTGAKYYFADVENILKSMYFQTYKVLKEGRYSRILLLENERKPGHIPFAKIFHFDDIYGVQKRNTYFNEVGILQELQHDNIAKCLYPIASPSEGVILMDCFPHGVLTEYLRTLSDVQVHQYFTQIASAVRYIHSKRIVHRNIKPDNILIKNGVSYLTDFGSSQKLGNDSSMVTGRRGTARFVAPEVVAATKKTTYDGFMADSYSLGVILWCMIMRKKPKKDTNKLITILKANEREDTDFDLLLVFCVARLLHPDLETRWDITTLLDYIIITQAIPFFGVEPL